MYVLKCFTDMSDRSIFEHMTRARPGDTFWAGCVTNMLSMAQNDGVITSNDAHVALGSRFRVMLEQRYGKNESDKVLFLEVMFFSRGCSRYRIIKIYLDSAKFNGYNEKSVMI